MARTTLVALAAVAWWAAAAPAGGTTLRVPSEYPTIQAGIDAAVSGDSVLVAPGTYTSVETRTNPYGTLVTACAFLKGGVKLISEAGPDATIIDQLGQVGPFFTYVVDAWFETEPTWIEGFTVTGGPLGANGLTVGESSPVTVKNCAFLNLDASDDGRGGAIVSAAEDLTILGCRFENCHAEEGGAIFQNSANLLVEDSVFEGCDFAGIRTYYDSGTFPGNYRAEIRRCEFYGNPGGGVGIDSYRGGVLVEDCVFVGNSDDNGAGGALSGTATPDVFTVRSCVFLDNFALSGGALNLAGPVIVEGSTFFGNHHQSNSFPGSAMRLAIGPLGITNCVIAGGYGGPGAIRIFGGTVTSGCNVFWENEGGAGHLVLDPTDREVDPLFCDPINGDFTVQENSPCLPAHSAGCGLIGAFGQGCGGVAVTPDTWTKTKALFRE